MLRQLEKVGSVKVGDGETEPLNIDIKHGGTLGRMIFQGFNGAVKCTGTALNDALSHLTLKTDMMTGDGFALLNQVTPTFLNYRHKFHHDTIGVNTSADMIHFDPAAGVGKDEGRRNQLMYGTNDMKSLDLDFQFAGDTAGCTRIETWVETDYNLKQNLGEHLRIGSQTVQVPEAGGNVEISTIPFGNPNLCLNAFHMEEPALLSVEEWTIAINSKQFPFRDTHQDIINKMLEYNYRSPQAGFATLDFNAQDVPAYFLEAGLGSLLVTPNFLAAAGAVTANGRIWFEQIFKNRKAA